MKKNIKLKLQTFVYSSVVLSVFLAIAYLFSFGFNLPNSLAQSKRVDSKREVKFINLTKSFQVAGSKITGDDINLVLQNNYEKSINGFYVREGAAEATTTNVELIYSDNRTEIAPGETFELLLGARERIYTEGITISAVMFTDGSSDGDPEIIQGIIDVRQGERIQMEVGLKLFRESAEKDYESRMAYLKRHISELRTKEESRSVDFNAGLFYGKERLKLYLKDIEKLAESVAPDIVSEFSKIQQKLERVVPKL
jgi:hypothetical protein